MAAGIYSTGTVSYSNGSPVVTGTGTAFVANVKAGYQLQGPNGGVYFVQAVNSDTSLTLTRNYEGASQAAQAFEIAPTGGVSLALADRVNALISEYADIAEEAGEGKFGNGTLAAPGLSFLLDQDTGIRRRASNAIALVAGGIDQFDVSGGVAIGAAVMSSMADVGTGKLMLNGGHGLGGQARDLGASEVLADISETCFVKVPTVDVETKGGPVGALGGVVLTQTFGSANAAQTYREISGAFRVWDRAKSGGVFVPWILRTNTLITTPTGTALRMGNGLQICSVVGATVTTSTASGSMFTSPTQTINFPAVFSANPIVIGNGEYGGGLNGHLSSGARALNPSQMSARLMTTGTGSTGKITAVALGFWE